MADLNPNFPVPTFENSESSSSASAEAALLLLRSKPGFLDEFTERVAQPGNKWLLSSNVFKKALSPRVVVRLRGVRWPTEEQRSLWEDIRDRQTVLPARCEDLSLWEQYERRLDWLYAELNDLEFDW